MKPALFLLLSIFALVFFQCSSPNSPSSTLENAKAVFVDLEPSADQFKDYWYRGKAEISSYDLKQGRYGLLRQGNAVLVFVTEPFSKSKQVKLNTPQSSKNDQVNILKLNFTRKFNTGIYPYSTMQSIFTPVDEQQESHTIKATTSSQEWCGHTFQQLNLQGDHYDNQLFSYFESEGDQKTRLDKTWLEDEIWNRIRIAPNKLPTGQIKIIPSALAARFQHFQLKNEAANATLKAHPNQKGLMQFDLQYQNIDRRLTINFSKAFPHEILSWEETNTSGWGANAQQLTTVATKKKTMMLDYWSKNGLNDAHYRTELGLD